MNFSLLDRLREQLFFLFNYVNDLKEENRELKRKVYRLEKNLEKKGAAPDAEVWRAERAELVEERDRLMMERELVRKKLETVIGRLDEALESEEALRQ
ncbi:MAG: hypothetical protein ACNS63_09350 [Candidatus Nitrospinota bacterium M3_3B_026]